MSDDAVVRIRAETSAADPNTCKFVLDRSVRTGAPLFFRGPDRAGGSPLVEALFALCGVSHVLVAENVVTVGKTPDETWSSLKPAIGAALRAGVLSGARVTDPVPAMAAAPGRLTGVVAERVRQVLEEQVNPSIAAHGGHAELVAVDDDTAHLRLSGGCAGCALASATLSQGIEVAIRQSVPEITRIVDVTDHSAGVNPYFS